jgi:hypothetical protein
MKSEEAYRRLETSRRRAEEALSNVRSAISGEVGFAPKRPYLLLALAAGAVGFALALRRRRVKRIVGR